MRFFLFSSWAYKAPLIRTLRRAEIIPPLYNPGSPVSFFLFGRKHHRHLPASHFRRLLDLSVFIQFMAQTLQNAHADVLVSHLPAPETQCNLRFIALFQKAFQVIQFNIESPSSVPGRNLTSLTRIIFCLSFASRAFLASSSLNFLYSINPHTAAVSRPTI